MDDSTANPIFIVLLGILRCLVPLIILLGISYLLKRLGFIKESPQLPEEIAYEENLEGEDKEETNTIEGEQANE